MAAGTGRRRNQRGDDADGGLRGIGHECKAHVKMVQEGLTACAAAAKMEKNGLLSSKEAGILKNLAAKR